MNRYCRDTTIPTIPVYTVTGAGPRLHLLEDVLEHVFERMDGTGESVRIGSIRMKDGSIEFRKPLRTTARKDVFWSVTASDLPLRGSGATPREAMDDLADHLVEAVGKLRLRGFEDDPLRTLFSEYIDLDRPCPDPDVRGCGESTERSQSDHLVLWMMGCGLPPRLYDSCVDIAVRTMRGSEGNPRILRRRHRGHRRPHLRVHSPISEHSSPSPDIGTIGTDSDVTGVMMCRNEDVTIPISEKKDRRTDAQKEKAGENEVIELSARSATEDIQELGGKAKVRIDTTGMDLGSPAVYWLKDDGTTENVDTEFWEGYAAIELSHFSLYCIAEAVEES